MQTNLMSTLSVPLDIHRIIYRYLYNDVLHQLLSSYRSRTLRLRRVLTDKLCERVRNDIVRYDFSHKKLWTYMKFKNKTPSNAWRVAWIADWDVLPTDLKEVRGDKVSALVKLAH
jgi:hypothetical protein